MVKSPASIVETLVSPTDAIIRHVEQVCASADGPHLVELLGHFRRMARITLKDAQQSEADLLSVTNKFASASVSERREMTDHYYGPHEKIYEYVGDLVGAARRAKSAAIAFRELACREDKSFPDRVGRISEPYWMDSTPMQSLVHAERKARSILELLVDEPRSRADALITEFEKWIKKLFAVVEAYVNASLDSITIREEALA